MATYRSYEEYLKTPTFRAVREFALRKNNYKCSRCENRATQIHHHRSPNDRYPPWNTWDMPSALEPICYECHCKEHGKPN